ncbi:MAG: DUF484 family protein [Burkholderiaceae bacterium]
MQTMKAGDAENDDGSGATPDQKTAQSEASVEMVPLSEQDLADYLRDNPEFFQRFGHVLADIRVPDQNAGRAISLQERQLEVLRDKHRQLEFRLSELVRMGQENDQIADRLASFTRELLLIRHPVEMPGRIEQALAEQFKVPQVVLRLWRVADEYADQPFAAPVEPDVQRYFDELITPYCGLKNDLAPIRWLPDNGAEARSVALLPLRSGVSPQVCGLIVFGSPDPDRFQSGMGTAFLDRIGEVASAALCRLMPEETTVAAQQD